MLRYIIDLGSRKSQLGITSHSSWRNTSRKNQHGGVQGNLCCASSFAIQTTTEQIRSPRKKHYWRRKEAQKVGCFSVYFKTVF